MGFQSYDEPSESEPPHPTFPLPWPVLPCRAKYPSMDLCYASGRIGGSMTAVLSAANEQAVAVSPLGLHRPGSWRAGLRCHIGCSSVEAQCAPL